MASFPGSSSFLVAAAGGDVALGQNVTTLCPSFQHQKRPRFVVVVAADDRVNLPPPFHSHTILHPFDDKQSRR